MSASRAGGGIRADGTWRNWAGNQRSRPARIERPTTEAEVVDLVRRAAGDGLRVRVVGAAHSFTGVARTDDVLVTLDGLAGVVAVDEDTGRVTVRAGTRLFDLNPLLGARGLAMPNLGDVAYQSVAGAISTSTHGTGLGFRSIAAAVVGLRLVAGDGTVVVLDDVHDPEALPAAARPGYECPSFQWIWERHARLVCELDLNHLTRRLLFDLRAAGESDRRLTKAEADEMQRNNDDPRGPNLPLPPAN